jgi:hypothetical protein
MKAIWVHADCLHRKSPAYMTYPEAPSLFIWDDQELRRTAWSLKRIGFIYECLLDLPVEVRRGDPVLEMQRFAVEMQCEGIVTMQTPDPHLQMQAKAMDAEILPQPPFVEVKGNLDLTRFSRYWRKVEKAL